jgi:transposase
MQKYHAMLKDNYEYIPSALDLLVFETLIPADHYLRRLKSTIDFTKCRALVADVYSPGMGRGALDPVFLLKLLLLQFHYGLSDERVIAESQVNIAFRFFLDLSVDGVLPEPSLLSQFRTRLGSERFESVFQEILKQARQAGLVKDRLRLKDATHVLANIAVPATIQLIAQIRSQLLEAAECFAPDEVAAHRRVADEVRQATADLKDEARLLRRVEHLRAIVSWGDQWLALLSQTSPELCSDEQRETFKAALELAHKILKDREPKARDKTVSLTDPDARSGKHGAFYYGYALDVSMDADSQIICAVEVLPANCDEAANAQKLIESEETAQGNNVEALSMDTIGYNGPVIKALSDDPEGPQLTVYVPPKEQLPRYPDLFQPDDFKLNEKGDALICPSGEQSRYRYRDQRDHGTQYKFSIKQCRNCPLSAQCLEPAEGEIRKSGRVVNKNDFQAQYNAVQRRATTEEYRLIRKEHPAIERKLNELVRWHDGRRVRYRGRLRVKVQYLMLAVVVNCKRMVRLLSAAPLAQPA